MKNKRIKIIIPDGLNASEESKAISRQLNQKLLSGPMKSMQKKRIGEEVNLSHSKTIIEVERKGPKAIEMLKCNVCECEYQSDMVKKVWTNYGGVVKHIKTCSDQCVQIIIDLCGEGRAATKRTKLKCINTFNKATK